MRKIDWNINASLTLIQGMEVVYWNENRKIWIFKQTKTPSEIILCEESIANNSGPWIRFLDLDSGRNSMYWTDLKESHLLLKQNRTDNHNYSSASESASSLSKGLARKSNNSPNGSSITSAIPSSKFSIFASIHDLYSLNQGQGKIFTLRNLFQSIFRIKLTLEMSFF
jgi:hypothetical protein